MNTMGLLQSQCHFSDIHRSMNTMGLVQSKRRHFAWKPLRSYFDECQKNEIHLLYSYCIFVSFFIIIRDVLM